MTDKQTRIVKALRCLSMEGFECPQQECDDQCMYWSDYDVGENPQVALCDAADLIEHLAQELDHFREVTKMIETAGNKTGGDKP